MSVCENYRAVEEKVRNACKKAGRSREEGNAYRGKQNKTGIHDRRTSSVRGPGLWRKQGSGADS